MAKRVRSLIQQGNQILWGVSFPYQRGAGGALPQWPGGIHDVLENILTDGGPGDDDLSKNGRISDDGGPGVTAGAGSAASIPTLSEWALMLFGLLLGGLVWRQRAASAHSRQR